MFYVDYKYTLFANPTAKLSINYLKCLLVDLPCQSKLYLILHLVAF